MRCTSTVHQVQCLTPDTTKQRIQCLVLHNNAYVLHVYCAVYTYTFIALFGYSCGGDDNTVVIAVCTCASIGVVAIIAIAIFLWKFRRNIE